MAAPQHDRSVDISVFLDSYARCRAAFLALGRGIDAVQESFVCPSLTGPDGEDLAIDVALAGPADARRLLVLCSGTHGNEGFAGSALQLDTMRRLVELTDRSGGVALLLIHGVNPFGWSHHSRTNENQVDLNRNFVDFSRPRREHPLAQEIQRISAISTANGPDFDRIMAELKALAEHHGQEAVGDAIQCGQYFKSDGIGYGGRQPEWSNRILRAVWAKYFPGRDVIGVIDWHTGLGRYGEPVFLCFDAPNTPSYGIAAAWWGEEPLRSSNAAYQSGARPNYSGLLMTAAQDAARACGAANAGAVIEFGTSTPIEAGQSLWIDRWLRNLPPEADAARVRELCLQAERFFYPNEANWNGKVLENGRRLISQAYEGLARHNLSRT